MSNDDSATLQNSNEEYPYFNGLDIGCCGRYAAAEIMLCSDVSVVPGVSGNSFSFALRRYFRSANPRERGFVSLRVSTRMCTSVGFGVRESLGPFRMTPAFGVSYGPNGLRPFLSVHFGIF